MALTVALASGCWGRSTMFISSSHLGDRPLPAGGTYSIAGTLPQQPELQQLLRSAVAAKLETKGFVAAPPSEAAGTVVIGVEELPSTEVPAVISGSTASPARSALVTVSTASGELIWAWSVSSRGLQQAEWLASVEQYLPGGLESL